MSAFLKLVLYVWSMHAQLVMNFPSNPVFYLAPRGLPLMHSPHPWGLITFLTASRQIVTLMIETIVQLNNGVNFEDTII